MIEYVKAYEHNMQGNLLTGGPGFPGGPRGPTAPYEKKTEIAE